MVVYHPFLQEDVITGEDGGSDDEQLGAEIHETTSEELKLKEIRKSKRWFYQIQQQYSKLGEVYLLLEHINLINQDKLWKIHKLRKQITKIVQKNHVCEGLVEFFSDLRPPNESQLKVLRQLIPASFIDQIAIKTSLLPNSSTLNKSNQNENHLTAYRTIVIKEDVFIHPLSTLFTSSINSPEY
ncbi:uncharacterized protein MELLADRAFT_58348 [Melampsora larici-populina 98AG31]|uniref:Uncharacterized protein n=1 Tax=Melampsora larici-populina (strain 98AG31 / pathotype 3-4-7) TaxID=747676 RepID=F4R363_MELLP|nr:uncharacterized protein MELLADRAFT_58348 [Melampsora larici-populina 98AG31]EGG12575.1 hypothetical protein MELLADRAFT_58348 [Melampsora larici-populina 98AG31]